MIIRPAESAQDFEAIARLMRSFVEWQYERHSADRHVIDSYFDPEKFAAELKNLPGEFGSPHGALLVADDGRHVAGCVALRRLSDEACEMKRLFVDLEYHGRGIGKLLGAAIVEEGRHLGYRRMLLDTGPAQTEAQQLYRKLGFRLIGPYSELSPLLRNWLVFMELDLTS